MAQRTDALRTETLPVARCRFLVRGFNRSQRRSTIRLNVIAQVRAVTIAKMIRRKSRQPGQPLVGLAATTIDARANGKAKTVWENLIISAQFRMVDIALTNIRRLQWELNDLHIKVIFFAKGTYGAKKHSEA